MTVERMVELLEIEKECVLRNATGECNRYCAGCDLLQDDSELHEMYTEAIALLKAQEPRVMTLEEVTEDCPDVVWFDDRHFVRVFAALPKNENYHGWVKFIWRDGYERHDHIDGYGKAWRCWTSRPTDEQREAIPWLT